MTCSIYGVGISNIGAMGNLVSIDRSIYSDGIESSIHYKDNGSYV